MTLPLAIVIEDDEDLSLVFSEAMTAAGYAVETFLDGSLALERLKETTPHLVVLDMHLPGVAGPDILKYIRSDERLRSIRVLIASADEQLAEIYRSQATLVLLKPISMIQLSALAQRFLRPGPAQPQE